jgi:hypothetical protein
MRLELCPEPSTNRDGRKRHQPGDQAYAEGFDILRIVGTFEVPR